MVKGYKIVEERKTDSFTDVVVTLSSDVGYEEVQMYRISDNEEKGEILSNASESFNNYLNDKKRVDEEEEI